MVFRWQPYPCPISGLRLDLEQLVDGQATPATQIAIGQVSDHLGVVAEQGGSLPGAQLRPAEQLPDISVAVARLRAFAQPVGIQRFIQAKTRLLLGDGAGMADQGQASGLNARYSDSRTGFMEVILKLFLVQHLI